MIKKTKIWTVEVTQTMISIEWEIDERIKVEKILLKFVRNDDSDDAGTVEVDKLAVGYDLMRLVPDKIYRIEVAPCDGKRRYSWSEMLVVKTLSNLKYELFYPSEKALKQLPIDTKELIQSRKLKDWDSYLSCGYKFSRPRELRETFFHRTLTYIDSLNILESDYQLNDDMFQGPFVKSKK